MRDSKTEILHFWFEETEPRQWFQQNDAFDEAIRSRFMNIYRLARDGVGLPVTGCAHSTKDIDGVINLAGGTPLVVKLIEGTQGVGVILAETKKAAQAVIEAFRGLDANILVQEFIKEAGGSDLRCFVVGGRVVAAMKRQASPGEFRSNLHRGGSGCMIELSPEEEHTAIAAAKALGVKIAGVDMLQSERGPLVMEVNSSPGLRGIEVFLQHRQARRSLRRLWPRLSVAVPTTKPVEKIHSWAMPEGFDPRPQQSSELGDTYDRL